MKLQVVVPDSAHVQAFYAKVHLVLLSHEPNLFLVIPSTCIDLLLIPQSLLHRQKYFPFSYWLLRVDPGYYTIILPTKRPTVLALSETTCKQVAVSLEIDMGCRRIKFL